MMLISTAFPRGHQRFTAAHELAHSPGYAIHVEIVIDSDLYASSAARWKSVRTHLRQLFLMSSDGAE